MSVYIPVKNRDTRYDLWHVHYEVRIPYIQMLEIDELEYGLPTSGDPHHDHAMQWEPRLVGLPIHRLAELHDRGANISLVHATDAAKIYEAIEKHLRAWKDVIERRFNPGTVPEEDLLCLDRFAQAVYPHAVQHFSNDFINANFVIAGKRAGGRRGFVSTVKEVNKRIDELAQRNKDNPEYKHIKVHTPVPVYDREARMAMPAKDYSGVNKEVALPPRASMASFLRPISKN